MNPCLDDETVLGLVEGRLAAVALAAAEAHLDQCPACTDVVAQLARASSPATVLERGHTVGRYVIGDLLGTGAMGRVYSAWQPELDRRVAIKVLREDGAGNRDRLVREAQAMAKLDHPNVVGVIEVGSTDAGVFVVMDLVEGDTLRAWATRREPRASRDTTKRDRPGTTTAPERAVAMSPDELAATTPARPWREIVRVLVEVARGLTAVHATGVVHRDIKPDNIIVGTDGRARLGDFGLARAASGPIGDDVLATSVAGTPLYMAPELLRGGVATAATDQYAFGVTAYELLSGRRPYSGPSWSELARAIERAKIEPIAGVPGWLDAAVRRCMSPDAADRFPSLAAAGDLLAERAARRRPIVWLAAAAGAAALASGATWYAVRGNPPPAGPSCDAGAADIAAVWNPSTTRLALPAPAVTALDAWTAAWAGEHDATCSAAHVQTAAQTAARERCLDDRRTQLAALLDRAGRTRTTDIADRLIDALAALPPGDCKLALPGTADPPPLDPDRATAVRDVEHALPDVRAAIALGDVRPVVETTATLVERARASGHAPTLAAALLERAEALRASAKLTDAAEAARDAAAAAERGHADDLAARAWLARVTLASDRRDLAAADDLAAIAAAAIDRAGAPPRLVAQLVRARGLVAYNRGRYADATALLVDARAKFAALSGERSLDVAAVESALGSVARASGDLDAAERHHRAALALDRDLRGPRHPDVARDLHNLAGVLRLRGDLDHAEPTYREALALEVALRGERGVDAGLTHNSLALVAMARRDWPAARAELELARDALAAAGHGDLAFAEHNLGLVAAATGNHTEALAHYARAAAIYASTIGDDNASAIRLYLDRARSSTGAAALADAGHALDAAKRANIPWIAEDAQAFLANRPPTKPAVSVSVERPPPRDRPATEPSRANPPVLPDPTPRRDVGTYGASQP